MTDLMRGPHLVRQHDWPGSSRGGPTLLLAKFARLAAQLGARDVAGARDLVASVHAVLAAVPRWLVNVQGDEIRLG